MYIGATCSRKISSRWGNMERRNVMAEEEVSRNLSSRERRELATGSKHRMRGFFRNRPMWKGVIVRCLVGDSAIDPIKRVRIDGLFQGIVAGSLSLSARNSNLVIQGAIFAVLTPDRRSHRSTSVRPSTTCWKSFCWQRRAQAWPTNEQAFRSRVDVRLSTTLSISS